MMRLESSSSLWLSLSEEFCLMAVTSFCSSGVCECVAGPLVYFLQQVDRALSRVSPFAAAGVVVGTVYWSAVTYGAVTVMQVWFCRVS